MQLNELDAAKTKQFTKINNWLLQEFKLSLKSASVTQLKEARTNAAWRKEKIISESDFNSYHSDKNYVKYMMIEHALDLLIARNRKQQRIAENTAAESQDDIDRAELLLAGQAIIDKFSKIVEDLAKAQVDELMPIVDEMKYKFGREQAEQFQDAMSAALTSAQDAAQSSKDSAQNALMVAQGIEQPEMDMGDEMDMDMGDEMDDDDFEDDFGAAAPSAGEDVPLGRAARR